MTLRTYMTSPRSSILLKLISIIIIIHTDTIYVYIIIDMYMLLLRFILVGGWLKS